MSGHSRWSTIKRKKGKADAQRGRLFTKLIRELTVSARAGGGDPDANPRLRTAVAAARQANMPQENIDRAVRRGTGDEPGVSYEEAVYEAYGPGGVAIMVEVLTDNRKRTASEVRHILTKYGARMGEPGSVGRLFEQRGLLTVERDQADEDRLMEVALEAGAEDIKEEQSYFEITTAPEALEGVRAALEESSIRYESAELARIPQHTVKLESDEARRILRIVESLEEQEDVQKVFCNFDISYEEMEKIAAA
jgi:YebC/PmpR family DNA-binding regulatory protein